MSFTKNSLLKSFRFPSKLSYKAVATKGKGLRAGLLNLKILPAPDASARFCFVVKKKNGCAVFRNRCRRILRPLFFSAAKNLKKPLWVMVMVNMNIKNADFDGLRECAEATVKKMGNEI